MSEKGRLKWVANVERVGYVKLAETRCPESGWNRRRGRPRL